ncbi:Major Facilitator Superfamily protein [Cohnella sp. OV330]|uniref:MFS transporter n=1 Tax=Cohnella sp. OV330 TaxID=1855288 RepID=UPI0008F3BBED|nr:MFS transporter [Cohnella sp. OV330]SFB56595.1 Major Facilitator Superfamily protein [Cohnella sp. OV330]
MIATQTDKEHAGYALATLSTASIAGSLLGPTVGDFIGENLGMRDVFFFTGALLLVAFVATALFVRESFERGDKKQVLRFREIWDAVPEKSLTLVLFATFFVLTVALYSVEPVLTVYITHLSGGAGHVALIAGITFSASGLANIFAAPRLGKLSDRIGAHKVMLASIAVAGLLFIPQAFVTAPWQLMILRFLLGLTSAGLTPAVNILLKKITPQQITGRVFGFSMSAGYLGVFAGSVLGGQVAAWFGLRYVFGLTGALLLVNAVWVYAKVYRKLAAQPSDAAVVAAK